jgi:hypothetical protein
MRKLFTIISLFFAFSTSTFAQTPVVCEDFATYDSTTAAVDYHGWYISYHAQFSLYTSMASSGLAPNSYKFGVDSATMITPNISGADHINFWMKGNASTGGTLANGKFYIYESTDSINYTLIEMISPIVAFQEEVREYALSPGVISVKFFYDKDSGNVAFDDFCATIGAVGVGVNENVKNTNISIYPNPSKGLTTINFDGARPNNTTITVCNVIGAQIKQATIKGTDANYQFDLSNFPDGVYFVKVKSDAGETTHRIVLRK